MQDNHTAHATITWPACPNLTFIIYIYNYPSWMTVTSWLSQTRTMTDSCCFHCGWHVCRFYAEGSNSLYWMLPHPLLGLAAKFRFQPLHASSPSSQHIKHSSKFWHNHFWYAWNAGAHSIVLESNEPHKFMNIVITYMGEVLKILAEKLWFERWNVYRRYNFC